MEPDVTAGLAARLARWRVWTKGNTFALYHAIDGDALTPSEWEEFAADLALVVQTLAEREDLLRDVLKDFDDDARGYCCIRDETVARLRALLPKEAPRG